MGRVIGMKPRRDSFTTIVFLILRTCAAPAACALALYTVLNIGGAPPTWRQAMLLVYAAILLTVAVPRLPVTPDVSSILRSAKGSHRTLGWVTICIGYGIAAFAGYRGYRRWDDLFVDGFQEYVLAAAVLTVGFVLVRDLGNQDRPKHPLRYPRTHVVEAVVVSAVLVIAVFFRLYHLDSFPPAGSFTIVDEPQIGSMAAGFLHAGTHPWAFPELVYGGAVSFKLFGSSMLSLRYVTVFAGIVLVCAFYPFARLFFSMPVAAAGTSLLATSRWHVIFTRFVIPAPVMMVYEFLIFWLAVRVVRGKSGYWAYAVMGLITGLGLYSHASFRLVPLLLVLWLAGWLITERARFLAMVRVHWPGWVLYVVTTAVVSLPYLGQIKSNPSGNFMERFTSIMPIVFARNTLPNPDQLLRENLVTVLGYYVGPGDASPALNPPNTAMLDPIAGTLFLLGLGYALLHLRRPFFLMLVSWLVLTDLAGGVLTLSADGHRFIGALPAVYLLACLPLEAAVWLIRERPLWVRRIGAAALTATLLVSARYNYSKFFDQQAHDPSVLIGWLNPQIDSIQYFRDHGSNSFNYQLADLGFPGFGSDFSWLANTPQGRNADGLEDILPIHDPPVGTGAHILFADPYPAALLTNAVSLIYPHVSRTQWTGRLNQDYFVADTVTAADIAEQQGLSGPCVSPATCLAGSRATPAVSEHAAYWAGSLYIPTSGTYDLNAGLGAVPGSLQLEGRPVVGSLNLGTGWYTIDLQAQPNARSMPQVQWTGPSLSGIVPLHFLRKSPASGMQIQFVSGAAPPTEIIPAERIPFPFFLYANGHNNGRPSLMNPLSPYRAVLTGTIGPGHPGNYNMSLLVVGGPAQVFLDGRQVAELAGRLDDTTTSIPVLLRLNGKRQELRIQFTMTTPFGENAGAGLVRSLPNGGETFLPWAWLTPPGPGGPPTWLGR
jgi:hypothetical protein